MSFLRFVRKQSHYCREMSESNFQDLCIAMDGVFLPDAERCFEMRKQLKVKTRFTEVQPDVTVEIDLRSCITKKFSLVLSTLSSYFWVVQWMY